MIFTKAMINLNKSIHSTDCEANINNVQMTKIMHKTKHFKKDLSMI